MEDDDEKEDMKEEKPLVTAESPCKSSSDIERDIE